MFKLKKLNCYISGHKLVVSKKVTAHVSEYTCRCCGKQLTTHENGSLIILTPKHKEINATLEKMYTNKLSRLKSKPLKTTEI